MTAELINDVPHARIAVENRVGEVGFPDSQRVFEKYYRAPHAHSRTGSGLGLYLVKQLVESLGGKVGYRALPDSVVFLLTLPVHWTSDTRRHLKDRVE